MVLNLVISQEVYGSIYYPDSSQVPTINTNVTTKYDTKPPTLFEYLHMFNAYYTTKCFSGYLKYKKSISLWLPFFQVYDMIQMEKTQS